MSAPHTPVGTIDELACTHYATTALRHQTVIFKLTVGLHTTRRGDSCNNLSPRSVDTFLKLTGQARVTHAQLAA